MKEYSPNAGRWSQLDVFESETRVQIVELLLHFEIMSLSEIRRRLIETYGHKITLSGLLKHMADLERVGIVRHDSGIFREPPDARKSVYLIQGKDRVIRVLKTLSGLGSELAAGKAFCELSRLARSVLAAGTIPQPRERKSLENLLQRCESEEMSIHLTEDETKKVRFWKTSLANVRELRED